MSVQRSAPITLWRTAAYLLDTIHSAFGEPAAIAACGTIEAKAYAHLIAWLRAAEHFLRRLLLLEAKALGAPAPSPALSARKLERTRAARPQNPRTSFRLCDAERRLPAGTATNKRALASQAKRDTGATLHFTRPLARRYEALLRVFANPAPYALRLARLIARIPKLIARFFTKPFQRKRKSGDPAAALDIIGHESWAELELALNSS